MQLITQMYVYHPDLGSIILYCYMWADQMDNKEIVLGIYTKANCMSTSIGSG